MIPGRYPDDTRYPNTRSVPECARRETGRALWEGSLRARFYRRRAVELTVKTLLGHLLTPEFDPPISPYGRPVSSSRCERSRRERVSYS
eukprot:1061741-Prorocentrum_minimum.AAC.1